MTTAPASATPIVNHVRTATRSPRSTQPSKSRPGIGPRGHEDHERVGQRTYAASDKDEARRGQRQHRATGQHRPAPVSPLGDDVAAPDHPQHQGQKEWRQRGCAIRFVAFQGPVVTEPSDEPVRCSSRRPRTGHQHGAAPRGGRRRIPPLVATESGARVMSGHGAGTMLSARRRSTAGPSSVPRRDSAAHNPHPNLSRPSAPLSWGGFRTESPDHTALRSLFTFVAADAQRNLQAFARAMLHSGVRTVSTPGRAPTGSRGPPRCPGARGSHTAAAVGAHDHQDPRPPRSPDPTGGTTPRASVSGFDDL